MANILALNPGSTSVEIGLFKDEEMIFSQAVKIDSETEDKIEKAEEWADEIINVLKNENVSIESIDGYAGRGAPLRPVESGVYPINQQIIDDILSGDFIDHASQFGALIGKILEDKYNIKGYIVDPVSVDEMTDVCRISGHKGLERKSLSHALNIKYIGRRFGEVNGKNYKDYNLIIAHLGGGISITAHEKGRMIDTIDANGEGPFSPERSGGLRVDSVINFIFANKNLTKRDFKKLFTKKSGLISYLETNDGREIKKRIENGDKEAEIVFKALALQISKSIAQMAVSLKGDVDKILLTGGLSQSDVLYKWICEYSGFISQIEVMASSGELASLAKGVYSVIKGDLEPKTYKK